MKSTYTILIALCIVVLSCATTGPGGQKSLIIIPSGQEVAIGAGMAEQVESQERLLADPEWQAYVNEVGQRIVVVCDRTDIHYTFKVIESDQVNAFAAPGGFVYFYTGLLREMDSEAEMAAVMAHEISHVVARHGIKRLQASLGVAMAYQLVFGQDGASEAMQAAIGVGMTLIFAGYSRDNEREADNYGIQYMVKAGYDPHGALGMFDKLAAIGSSHGEASSYEKLVSSHPDTQERIQNAAQQIAEMTPLPGNLTANADRYRRMKISLPKES